MSVKIGQVLTRAYATLNDEGAVRRWAEARMVEFLSDAQREVVVLKPSAYSKTAVVQAVAGTKQSLPAGGLSLIAVTRAMGLNGSTPGLAVREASKAVLDAQRPGWHTDAADIQPDEFLYDDRDPATYWLHPGQPDTPGQIEVVYADTPPELVVTSPATVDTVDIALADVYLPALTYYVVFRALAMERSAQQIGKAAAYYEMFRAFVEGRAMSKSALNPEQQTERARQ